VKTPGVCVCTDWPGALHSVHSAQCTRTRTAAGYSRAVGIVNSLEWSLFNRP